MNSSPAKTPTAALLSLMLLAMVLRSGSMIALKKWERPGAAENRQLALSLVDYGTLYYREWEYFGSSSVEPPLYPMILAGCFSLLGRDSGNAYTGSMLINALVAALTVPMLFELVRNWGGSTRAGLLAAGMLAVWPSQVYWSGEVQAGTLAGALLVGVLWQITRALSTGAIGHWIAGSVMGALAVLCDPVLLAAMVVMLVVVACARPAGLLFMLSAIALLVLPWWSRNLAVHDRPVPQGTHFWSDMWKGNNPHASGSEHLRAGQPKPLDLLTPQQRDELSGRTEAAREDLFRTWTSHWIATNPLRYAELCARRLWLTVWTDLNNPRARNALWIASRTSLLPLTVLGAILAWRRGWRVGPAIAVLTVCVIAWSLTLASDRNGLLLEPLQLALCAGVLGSRRDA